MAKSLEQLRAAAAAGNSDANFRLALMNERGDGLPQDRERALFYYPVAARLFAEAGDEDEMQIAAARRGSIARALSPEAAVLVAYEAMNWRRSPAH